MHPFVQIIAIIWVSAAVGAWAKCNDSYFAAAATTLIVGFGYFLYKILG